MKSTKSVGEIIFNTEGFEVVFTAPDGSDVSSRRVQDYPYQRAARSTWTVTQWKEERFLGTYPDFEVVVLDPDGDLFDRAYAYIRENY